MVHVTYVTYWLVFIVYYSNITTHYYWLPQSLLEHYYYTGIVTMPNTIDSNKEKIPWFYHRKFRNIPSIIMGRQRPIN